MRTGALAAVLLCAALVLGLAGQSASAEAQKGHAQVRKAVDRAIGASIVHPKGLLVEREEYTDDGTYGFTLWRPGSGASGEGGGEEGGEPVARVALAYDLGPGEVEKAVREKLAALRDVPAKRETVSVGKRKLKGVALGPIPGSTPSTEVYVSDEGRVYRINVYGETLDAGHRKLLSGLEFGPPSRSAASLDALPDAGDPKTFYDDGGDTREREEAARRGPSTGAASRAASMTAAEVPRYAEKRIAEGCWLAQSTFFFQTQHGRYANSSASDGIPTGFTRLGSPNYWGAYTHGNLGYGRCASTYYTNDKFAVDYPLNFGDAVFSPFRGGTVTFAGRNSSHKNYGIFVVIKADNGKYVNLSAHLNGLAPGIRPGARVTDQTIMGYAGDTGDPSVPVGPPHLHQAFYRYPGFLADGSPYGGQGLQAVFHRYVGTAAKSGPGVHKYGWTKTSAQLAKGSLVSN